MRLVLSRDNYNSYGFSVLELVVATLLLSIGILGASSIFSSIGNRSRTLTSRRGTFALGDSIRRGLAADLKANWIALSGKGCDGTKFSLQLPSFPSAEYSAVFLDSDNLQTALPKTLSDGSTDNPLRTAIDLIKSEPSPSIKCMDTDFLTAKENSKYSVIANSEKNQVLCKCATARTPYGTLFDKANNTSLGSHSGLYSCLLVTSSKSASDSIIVESTFSFLNITDGTVPTCTSLGGKQPSGALGQLDYVIYGETSGQGNDHQLKGFPGTVILE